MFLHAQPQVCSPLGVNRDDEVGAVIECDASEGSGGSWKGEASKPSQSAETE